MAHHSHEPDHQALAAALAVAAMVLLEGRAPEAAPRMIPVEVELIHGAAPCAPHYQNFDARFRSAFAAAVFPIREADGAILKMPNGFCFATARPEVRPLRVRAELRCDAQQLPGLWVPAPGGARMVDVPGAADHWTVQVAVPWHGMRLAPAHSHRFSFWSRSDRPGYCDSIATTLALLLLEALHRETGAVDARAALILPRDIARDPKHSAADQVQLSERIGAIMGSIPLVMPWVVLLAIGFLAVRRSRSGRARET